MEKKMTSFRRRVERLGVAGALMLVVVAPAAGQESSPCAGGAGALIQQWEAEGVPGTKGAIARSSMECLADGSIRHVVEISKDDGKTWRMLFESTYAPAGGNAVAVAAPPQVSAPPVPAATTKSPAPAATSSPPASSEVRDATQSSGDLAQPQATRQASIEGSDVQALSRELGREEIAKIDAPELMMASPLILEVTPGEVDDYPEGSAWSTQETAGFICENVVIKKLTVGRKVKGADTHLDVGLTMFSQKRQRTVDLLVEAIADGQVVGSTLLENVKVGFGVPAHGNKGLPVNAIVELPEGGFDRLFADGVARTLRLTVTVASS